MKFHHFCQNSPYFIKLAEHIGIIIRNMQVKFQPIQRSSIFSQKNADSAGPRYIMKFQHFFKVHQLSSNLQNILESSSETCMWNLSLFREVKFFHRKMLTLPALQNVMKFQHFFKVHLISSNLQNILESSSETCMWSLSLFREVNLFQGKMPTVPALWNIMKFQHFFQNSPNFIKLVEHIGIIIRNMHVKFEPIQRS